MKNKYGEWTFGLHDYDRLTLTWQALAALIVGKEIKIGAVIIRMQEVKES